jgi:multiple sugar transport system substrate-binding protein
MSKVRTRVTAVSALAALAFLIAGCGGPSSTGADTASGNINVSYWGSPARADKMNKVINLFQAKNADIKVQSEVADYNSYVERLTVRAAGNNLACVVGMQSYFQGEYADKNVLMPLDDYIKSGIIDVSGIPKELLDAGKVNGKQYVIPTGAVVRLLAYNDDMIKKAGGALPQNGMTWEEYSTWLKDTQQKLPGGAKAAEIEGEYLPTLTSWVIGHGQTMFENGKLGFSKDLLTDWFKYWMDLQNAGVTVGPAELQAQAGALETTPLALGKTATGGRDIPQLFITQQTLSSAGKGSHVGYVTMPTESKDHASSFLGINGFAIPRSCDRPQAAAKFISFFADDPAAGVAFQSDNGVVTSKAQQAALSQDQATPAGVKQSIQILQDLTKSNAVTNTAYPAGIATLRSNLSRIYEQVAFGRMSIDDAVSQFFSSAQTALK